MWFRGRHWFARGSPSRDDVLVVWSLGRRFVWLPFLRMEGGRQSDSESVSSRYRLPFSEGIFTAVGLIDIVALSLLFWLFAPIMILAFFVNPNHPPLLGSPYNLIFGVFFNQLALIPSIFPARGSWRKDGCMIKTITSLKKFNYFVFPPVVIFWHLPRGIAFVARRTPSFTVQLFNDCVQETKKISRLLRRFCWRLALRIYLFVAFLKRQPHCIAKWLLCHINDSILIAKKPCRFLKRFCWELFLRIHSEIRLLCGIDAMIGTTIGYFAGSAIIGALVGGLFGVLNYAIITELYLKRLGYLPIKE